MFGFTFRSLNDLDATTGTVTLVDGTPFPDSLLMTANHEFKDKKSTDIVLIPQPSDDVNDPLNWPAWKKAAAFIPICCFAGLTNWVVAGPGTAIVVMMEEFGTDLNTTVNGVINWTILTLGLGVDNPPLVC